MMPAFVNPIGKGRSWRRSACSATEMICLRSTLRSLRRHQLASLLSRSTTRSSRERAIKTIEIATSSVGKVMSIAKVLQCRSSRQLSKLMSLSINKFCFVARLKKHCRLAMSRIMLRPLAWTSRSKLRRCSCVAQGNQFRPNLS